MPGSCHSWRADGGAFLAGGTAGASVDRGAAAVFIGLHLEGWRAVASSIGTGHGSTGYQWRKMAIQGTTGAKFAILPHSIEETGHFAEICDFSQIPYKIGDIFVMI